jgi:Protein of unknown function (DUF742)
VTAESHDPWSPQPFEDELGDSEARPPDPRMIPAWDPFSDVERLDDEGPRHLGETDEDLMIRPFLLTGGRTRPAEEAVRLEAQVVARGDATVDPMRFEALQILEACQHLISVAEVAARLRLPLGVVRVLVADLVAEEHLDLVQPQALSVALLERIRDRVRAL